MNYDNNIIAVELEDCVVEVDTTPVPTIYKEESITDTLYSSALQQRNDRIENDYFTQRG